MQRPRAPNKPYITQPCSQELRLRDAIGGNAMVVGMHVSMTQQRWEVPLHQHRQGQLVLALRGSVTCEVSDALWMVPPGSAVWIPGHTPHSVAASANARINYVLIQPSVGKLPQRCCTLAISPLARELVLSMADAGDDYAPDSGAARKARVLLDELEQAPLEALSLAMPTDARLRLISRQLRENPADRRTLKQWAAWVAMGERTLARLIQHETGLTFGRWRQQFYLIVALQRLAAGESVQQVAERLGYNSVTAFISMFKKALGKPPAKYFTDRT